MTSHLPWKCAPLRAALICLSLGTTLSGCGGPDGPEIIEVTGTVTMGGSPVADAQVQFTPNEGRPSFGTTDAEGKYRLEYTSGRYGAVPGRHRVSINKAVVQGEFAPGEEPEAEDPIPAKYNDNSTLTADVSADATVHDFQLEQ